MTLVPLSTLARWCAPRFVPLRHRWVDDVETDLMKTNNTKHSLDITDRARQEQRECIN